MSEIVELKWKRSDSEFPKVWSTFKARDSDSDDLVEYRIQDLPESRFADALKTMVSIFCDDEPLAQAYELFNDPVAMEDYSRFWRSVLPQKCVLACFKDGSDEIAGLNFNYVASNGEKFGEEINKQNKSQKAKTVCDICSLIDEKFDTFEYYGVDKYLASSGLVVPEKYRGRGIGEHLLKTREPFCKAFDIKLTSTTFTSTASNKVADKAGFKVVKTLSYNDIRTTHPQFRLPPIKSDVLTLKSIVY